MTTIRRQCGADQLVAGEHQAQGVVATTNAQCCGVEQAPSSRAVRFDTSGLGRWDSGLVTRLIDIYRDAQAHSIPFDDGGLPDLRSS